MLTAIFAGYVDRFACDWHRFSTTDPGLPFRSSQIVSQGYGKSKHYFIPGYSRLAAQKHTTDPPPVWTT